MTERNSSISNFKVLEPQASRLFPRKVGFALIWALIWLGLIDFGLNKFFALPKSPLTEPSKLQNYFNHGRSVEAKIRNMVGKDKKSTAELAYAGWLIDDDPKKKPITASKPGQILIAAYGQSFTAHICKALQEIDSRFELRLQVGPSAPLNHSYAFYTADTPKHQADVVILGILASSLPLMMSPTISTVNFEGAAPFIYPFYSLKNGQLLENDPVIHSLEELRVALWQEPKIWDEYLYMLETKTPYYNRWVYKADWMDFSAIGRLLRRANGQKHKRDITARYWDESGFKNTDGMLEVANTLIIRFAQDVKARGQIPYILLIQDKGYKDHLVQAFNKTIAQYGIPYLSTHEIAPDTNLGNFKSDGHFTASIDKKIAQTLRNDLLKKLREKNDVAKF